MVRVDEKGRVPLGPLKVYPKILREISAMAYDRGFSSPAYFALYLIGRELGHLPKNAGQRATVNWLKSGDRQVSPRKPRPRKKGVVAVDALKAMPSGSHPTKDIAKFAELSYQQTYRQLTRSDEVEKLDVRGRAEWQLRSIES